MKKGDTITIVVDTPFASTEELGIIGKLTKDCIYIEGLKVPFNRATGRKVEVFAGAGVYIKEINENKK